MADQSRTVTDADRDIGNRVAALRSARGLSRAALGQAIGVTHQQVQKYECGHNRIGAARLRMVATVLDVPMEALFSEPDFHGADRSAPNSPARLEAAELAMAFAAIADAATRARILAVVRDAAVQDGVRRDRIA